MSQIKGLIKTLKQCLKEHGVTYQELASRLGMSEANIKRLFSSQRFSLEQLEDTCRVIGLEMSDLFQQFESSRKRITTLTKEQEKELVSDTKLLLVAVSVRNHLTFDEMVHQYELSETECIRHLARLDKLKIIDLLPNNRIRLRIDDHFHWLPNGPIERFYESKIQTQFLKSMFSNELEQRIFNFGLLSETSTQWIIEKLNTLAKEFSDLHGHDAKLPLEKRHSIGLMMAIRPWDLDVFVPLQKHKK